MPSTQNSVRPFRILFAQNSADLYGGSRCLMRMAGALAKRGHHISVVLNEEGPLVGWLVENGIKSFVQPDLRCVTRKSFSGLNKIRFLAGIPMSAIRVAGLVRNERIEIIHSNVGTIVSAAMGAKLAGVPHIWHIRDWYQEFRSLWKYYCWYILKFSARVLPSSIPIAAQFPESAKVLISHDGLDSEEFAVDRSGLREEFQRTWGLADQLVIGCVGRIKFVRKGQEFLVRAARILRDSGHDFRVLIVGAAHPDNADHDGELRKLVSELGLDDVVIFTGELPDARPAYCAMDILVLPSAQPEPFGGVVMEAMGMGLPVVATRLGGSIEQVDEGVSGLLVEPADPGDLASKLETLIRDPERRRAMGRAGETRLREKFSIDAMTDRIENVYRDALLHRAS